MPLFQPARATGRALGAGPDGREDERMPLAPAGARGAIRIRRVDPDGHLRHSRFVALKEEKDPREVRQEEE